MPNLLKRFVKPEDSVDTAEVSTSEGNQTFIASDVVSETDKPLVKKACKTKMDAAAGRREAVTLMRKTDSISTLTSKINYHDNKQLKTESSSSSSSQALVQDSSRMMSTQEKSSEGHKPGIASGVSSSRMNKLANTESYCGMQAVGDPCKASVCSSSVVSDKSNNETIDKLTSSFDSTSHQKKADCLSRNAEHSSCCTGPDTHIVHPRLKQQLSSEKSRGPSEESTPSLVHDKSTKVVVQQQESSLLTTKSDNDTVADLQSPSVFQFDLNESMETDDEVEMLCPQQSANETAASSGLTIKMSEPITVVAKMGVPVGVPRTPLQFDGKLGWGISAATSAFRPAELKMSKRNNDKCVGVDDSSQALGLQGIDLNIAAVESDDFCSRDSEHIGTFPPEYSARVSSVGIGKKPKEMERVRFDLNNQAIDLNYKSSVGENAPDQPGQTIQPVMRNYAELNTTSPVSSQIRSSRQAGFNNDVRSSASAYWVDLSCMPAGFSHGQPQPFLVAVPPGVFPSAEQIQAMVPLQSKPTFSSVPHPPAFYISPTNSHPSSVCVNPTMFPPQISSSQLGAATLVPQVSAGSVLATYPGSLHALENNPGLTPGGYTTTMRPSFVLNSAGGYSMMENRNRGAETKELLRPPGNNTFVEGRMKSVQQVSLSASPNNFKRRQPEGGWDSLQLNYKQPDPWK